MKKQEARFQVSAYRRRLALQERLRGYIEVDVATKSKNQKGNWLVTVLRHLGFAPEHEQ